VRWVQPRVRLGACIFAACRFAVTSGFGTELTSCDVRRLVAIGGKADVARISPQTESAP
jgi:hypothetical protein